MQYKKAVFYCRASSAHAEHATADCVEQAKQVANNLGFQFQVSPNDVELMIQKKISDQGDVYFDFDTASDVSGRPGLAALCHRARHDKSVSLVMVPDLTRLSRDPADVVRLVFDLYSRGVTFVFLDDCPE